MPRKWEYLRGPRSLQFLRVHVEYLRGRRVESWHCVCMSMSQFVWWFVGYERLSGERLVTNDCLMEWSLIFCCGFCDGFSVVAFVAMSKFLRSFQVFEEFCTNWSSTLEWVSSNFDLWVSEFNPWVEYVSCEVDLKSICWFEVLLKLICWLWASASEHLQWQSMRADLKTFDLRVSEFNFWVSEFNLWVSNVKAIWMFLRGLRIWRRSRV